MKSKIAILCAFITVTLCVLGAVMTGSAEGGTDFVSSGVIDSATVKFDARAFEAMKQNADIRAATAYMDAYTQAYTQTQNKTANIVYEYHHHYDGNGNEITQEDYISPVPGGCYTEPVYHTHTNACYKTTYTVYEIIPAHDYGGQVDNGNNRFMCSGWPKHYYSADAYLSGKGCTHETKTLICDRAGQLEGYRCTCGKRSGQIVSATVSFE